MGDSQSTMAPIEVAPGLTVNVDPSDVNAVRDSFALVVSASKAEEAAREAKRHAADALDDLRDRLSREDYSAVLKYVSEQLGITPAAIRKARQRNRDASQNGGKRSTGEHRRSVSEKSSDGQLVDVVGMALTILRDRGVAGTLDEPADTVTWTEGMANVLADLHAAAAEQVASTTDGDGEEDVA